MAQDIDYRKFKTPFYEISVGDSSGKRMVNLPHHILRLVEKVEIFETFEAGQFSTISVTFVEGSREPASQDPTLGTSGLYKIANPNGRTDMDISGSLTNRTGVITDLRFSGNSGITFLSEDERKTGSISDKKITNVEGNKVSRLHKNESKNPIFLFQERNQIRVTWGYKEDPSSIRHVRGYIIMINTTFPENAHPRTVVTCQDTGAFLDQLAPKKGVAFGKRISTGTNNSLVTFEDLKTDDLIKKICNDAGMPCIVSKNLPAEKLDKDKQKIWLAGESFHQFMEKLADAHNAYYKVIPDPKTGTDTLLFIKKQDFESKPVVSDLRLFKYKSPGSILKTVDIKADFGMIGASSQIGVDTEGKEGQATSDGEEQIQLFNPRAEVSNTKKREVVMDFDPTSNNPINACVNIKDTLTEGDFTGRAENTPTENEQNNIDSAKIAAEQNSRAITLEMTTQGYTKLTPGVIEIGGIGLRYSGKYRVLTVNHILDNKGYNCRATATTYSLAQGGVEVREAQKGVDIDPKVSEQLFTPARESNNKIDRTVREQYSKLIGTQ